MLKSIALTTIVAAMLAVDARAAATIGRVVDAASSPVPDVAVVAVPGLSNVGGVRRYLLGSTRSRLLGRRIRRRLHRLCTCGNSDQTEG